MSHTVYPVLLSVWTVFVAVRTTYSGPGSSVGGRSVIESRWGRDFPPVQTGSGAHPAYCTMGTESLPGVEAAGAWGWPQPHLECRGPRKSRAIPLLTLRACVAYKRVKTYLELHTTTAPEFYICSSVHRKSRLNKSNKMQQYAETLFGHVWRSFITR